MSDPSDTSFPATGRIAGIDFGTVRIGVAITDPDRILASPFENYDRKSKEADSQYFKSFAKSEKIVGFVVGLPLHTSGEESQKSAEAREFGAWLNSSTELPVTFFDERFTSTFADQILAAGDMTRKKKKKRLDMIAAQIILTAFLESTKTANSKTDISD